MTDLVWIDGDPLMEAIAATVYDRCQHSDSGLVIDDPRNIAVACVTALRSQQPVLPAPVDRAACDCEAEVHMGLGFYHHPWCATKRRAAPADRAAVPVPRETLRDLIHVAAWVSRGRTAAFTPDDNLGEAYPDARARRALGAIDELDLRRMADEAQQPEEPQR